MNQFVTEFLAPLNHPFAAEIDTLRQIILDSQAGIEENIKWNGPNYVFQIDEKGNVLRNSIEFRLVVDNRNK